MRSGAGLCALALLCLHSYVCGQGDKTKTNVDVHPGVLIFCDDPSVVKAVSSAVQSYNEKQSTGHKLALFQTLSASKSENGANSVYSLQFTTRRSDCLVGDKKPWTDCNYLPYGHKNPIPCNATVHMSETKADTKQVHCLIDHVTPEKAACLGCPEDIDENSEDIKVPLIVSILKYNAMSNHAHLFTLHSLGPATRQIVAGLRYTLTFDMMKTKCAKAEHKDLNQLCVYDEENVEFVHCNATVDVAPWRFENPEAHLECRDGQMPTRMFTRRRPPGWSPLRNLLFDVPPSVTKPTNAPSAPSAASAASAPSAPSKPSEPSAPSAAPSKAPAKKESSEEDTTASKPTPATKAAEEVNKNPFHCPSKPWKPFHPVQPPMSGAPPKAPAAKPPHDTPTDTHTHA